MRYVVIHAYAVSQLYTAYIIYCTLHIYNHTTFTHCLRNNRHTKLIVRYTTLHIHKYTAHTDGLYNMYIYAYTTYYTPSTSSYTHLHTC